jgi:hypothetical protein
MERIDVTAYAGQKGDERPETFILHGLRIDVVEIAGQWIEEGSRDRVRKRFFRVKGSNGNMHTIYFNETVLEWYYSSVGDVSRSRLHPS